VQCSEMEARSLVLSAHADYTVVAQIDPVHDVQVSGSSSVIFNGRCWFAAGSFTFECGVSQSEDSASTCKAIHCCSLPNCKLQLVVES
jgi:hypothetical protein